MRSAGYLWWAWKTFVWLITGEFLLLYRANGGAVVLFRALFTSSVICALAVWLHDGEEGQNTLQWFGAALAVTYAAFYARFAAQWTYLAGVYNAIMSAKVRNPPESGPAEEQQAREEYYALWEAGFIEDAEDVHLALKPMYAFTIASYLNDQNVRKAYANNTYRPAGHWRILRRRVARVLNRQP